MNKNGFEDRSEDRRVRKSKKALEEALIRLLAKKTITDMGLVVGQVQPSPSDEQE